MSFFDVIKVMWLEVSYYVKFAVSPKNLSLIQLSHAASCFLSEIEIREIVMHWALLLLFNASTLKASNSSNLA